MAQRGRKLDYPTRKRIKQLGSESVPIRKIARTIGVARNTARKYVRSAEKNSA